MKGILEKSTRAFNHRTANLMIARGVMTLPISYRFEVKEGENQFEKLLSLIENHNVRIETVALFNEVLEQEIRVTVEDHQIDWDLIEEKD